MYKNYNGSMYELKLRPTFAERYEEVDEFYNLVSNIVTNMVGIDANELDEDVFDTIYYLLYARYGNSQIASSDMNQFDYQVASTIYMYAPTWIKRISLQKDIRKLTLQDVKTGTKQIVNHANNPSTAPSTSTLEELTYINDQTTQTFVKGDFDAYTQLWSLLETDVTKEFIDRFNKYFVLIPSSGVDLYYESEEE